MKSQYLELLARYKTLTEGADKDVDHSAELLALSRAALVAGSHLRLTFLNKTQVQESNDLSRLAVQAKREAEGQALKSQFRELMASNPSREEARKLAKQIREYILFSGVAGTLDQATEWAAMLNTLNRI